MADSPCTLPKRLLVLTPARPVRQVLSEPVSPRIRASLTLRRVGGKPGALQRSKQAWSGSGDALLWDLNLAEESRDDARPAA